MPQACHFGMSLERGRQFPKLPVLASVFERLLFLAVDNAHQGEGHQLVPPWEELSILFCCMHACMHACLPACLPVYPIIQLIYDRVLTMAGLAWSSPCVTAEWP